MAQFLDGGIQLSHGWLAIVPMMLLQMLCNVRDCKRRPADTHSGAEHFFEAGVHLFFLDEFAPVGAGFAFLHGGAETRILVHQPHGCVFHKHLWVGPSAGRDLGDLCFLS